MSHGMRSIATTDLPSICILDSDLLMPHNIGHMFYAGETPWHGLEETEQRFRHLAAQPCDDAAFRRFLAKLLPDPARPATAARNRSVAAAYETRLARLAEERAAILHTRDQGVPALNVPAEPRTWWGSVNAVTAWVDHVQPTAGDRYAHAMLGAGDRLKSAAHDLAVAEAGR